MTGRAAILNTRSQPRYAVRAAGRAAAAAGDGAQHQAGVDRDLADRGGGGAADAAHSVLLTPIVCTNTYGVLRWGVTLRYNPMVQMLRTLGY